MWPIKHLVHKASNGPCMSVLTLEFWLQVVR